MLAIIFGLLALVFGVLGLLMSDDKPFRFIMKYAALLTIIITLFEVGASSGFGAAVSALYMLFISIFLIFLIFDIVGIIPILLKVLKYRKRR